MLFLQNFERSVKWFLMVSCVIRPAISLLTKPLMGPVMEVVELISPVWCMFAETGRLCFSTAQVVLVSSYSTILYLAEVLQSPFGLLFSYVLTIVESVSPVFYSLWELLLVPVRFLLVLANYAAASLFSNIYYVLRDFWESASGVTQLTSGAKPGVSCHSKHYKWFHCFLLIMQQAQVKHMQPHYCIPRRLYQLLLLTPYACSCRRAQRMEHHYCMVESKECDFCK